MMFSPSFLILLAGLLAFCGLATVFAVVYAIVNKRPGVIAWTAAGLLLLLVGFGAVGTMFIRASNSAMGTWQTQMSGSSDSVSDRHFEISYQSDGNDRIADISQPLATTGMHVGIGSIKVVVLFFVLLAIFAVVRQFRPRHDGERRGWGWGWAALLIVLALFVLPPRMAGHEEALRRAEASRREADRQVEQAHRQFEQERQRAEREHHQAALAIQNGALAEAQQSVVAMWDKMNEPKIQLSDGNANMSMVAKVEARSGDVVESQHAAPVDEPPTRESLARSRDKLERLARQVASVARDVSEVAELVGRGLIAQPESANAVQQPMAATTPVVPPETSIPPAPNHAPSEAEKVIPAAATKAAPAVELAEADPATPAPNWINDPPKKVGNNWREVVATDEYATLAECNRQADRDMIFATYNHIQRLVSMPEFADDPDDAGLSSKKDIARSALAKMGVSTDYINRQIIPEGGSFVKTIEHDFGPMKKVYRLLEFSPPVDRDLRMRWEGVQRNEQLAGIGMGTGGVIGLIGLAFGLLKIDTWTKGYYSKRLFLGVPAAIVGILTLLAMVVG